MMLGLELIYPLREAQYLYIIHGLIFKKLYYTDLKIFDQRLISGSSAAAGNVSNDFKSALLFHNTNIFTIIDTKPLNRISIKEFWEKIPVVV